MTYLQNYNRWLNSPCVDEKMKEELRSIQGDEKEIESRFFSMLSFGTAGLRGILGAGLFRMNIYTVRYATQGMADLIVNMGEEGKKRGVVIAYDCRNMSWEFACEAACVLAANGIRVFLFDALRPTPELSFAVRYLGTIAGINITASHNPKEYNGYKAYWEDGAQLSQSHAAEVSKSILSKDIFDDTRYMTFEEAKSQGFVTIIGEEIDKAYLRAVLGESVDTESIEAVADQFSMVYTPFHGAGYRMVPEILSMIGIKNLHFVKEQMVPDGNFPTVKSPNPEEKEGFALAIELAKKEGADLILGTDPDADRVGIIVKNNEGQFVTLSGNQVGVMLLDFIIKGLKAKGQLPANALAIKTVVTTQMADKVAKDNGVDVANVFTGFRFIGERMKEAEETGKNTFIFGFEESYGYLKGTYARDKDAIVAAMLIAQMACSYRKRGMSLYEGMESLYKEYGYFSEQAISVVMEGLDGLERMKGLMQKLRLQIPGCIAGQEVTVFKDYEEGYVLDMKTGQKKPTGFQKSNVLSYEFDDGSSFHIRPSGTEPKIKCYLLIKGDSHTDVEEKMQRLIVDVKEMLK
jgi:phosphoglucomutase